MAGELRILVLGVNFAPESTGIAPYTTKMVQGLVDRGHDVRVLTSFPHYPAWRVDPATPERGELGGAGVRRLRHYVPSRPTGLRRMWFEISFGMRLVLARWGRPDVVICVSPAMFSSSLAVLRAKLRRRRIAIGVIVQDLYSRGIVETGQGGAGAGRIMHALEAWLTRSVDGVSVIHPRFKNTVVDRLGVEPGRVTVIRNWSHVLPAEAFDIPAFRDRMGWSPDEVVVLHTGAMGLKQALDNVIEAARLAEARQSRVRFVLLGNGSQRGRLEILATGLESVTFVDSLSDEDYGRALASADLLLVNERAGVADMAVPSKLTSYFSAGRPVVAATSATSATAEEVGRAGAGVVVTPELPNALLDAVEMLADDPAAAGFGLAAQRYAQEILSEGAALDEYDAWVRVLHAKANRRRT